MHNSFLLIADLRTSKSLIKGIVDSTILRKEKNAIIGDVCSISEQIRAEANIDDIITVRLHGNGVCKSSAENLQLGATQYYRRRAGQLIYGKQNFHNGAIGIVPISLDNGITSKDIPSFDIDEMKCNSVYLLAQLQSPQYYKPAEALTTGTGSKRLKEETFLKMPIVLPNKREQDNIAVLIHRASMNLDHAKRLLELLSIQKQFLLRQMFIETSGEANIASANLGLLECSFLLTNCFLLQTTTEHIEVVLYMMGKTPWLYHSL